MSNKIYTHNDYYGYINKIQEQAISNPQWFWSDDPNASEARQWLYDNDAEEIVDNIYHNTPEDIQRTIDNNKLSTTSQFNKFHDDWKRNQEDAARTVGAVVAGSAIAPYATSALISSGSTIAAALNTPTGKFIKHVVDRVGTIDGIRNAFSENGIKKTINKFGNKDYWGAARSAAGDLLDIAGTYGYIKNISTFPKDIRFAIKFFKDKPNANTVEKVYNAVRPISRAVLAPVKDIINPTLYGISMLNAGEKTGTGFIRNVLGKDKYISGLPLENVKSTHGLKNKFKAIKNNIHNTLNVSANENLNDVYGQYFFPNTMWESLNPSTLKLSSDPIAKQVFEETKGLSRYSDLPIYELDLHKRPTVLGEGSSYKIGLYDNLFNISESGIKPKIRGTYKTKHGKFRPKTSPTESIFTQVNQDVGGHFVNVTPRKDLSGNRMGHSSYFYDVGIKDTQHFTPTDYMKKWKEKKWKMIPLAIFDNVGNDFNLFGRGVYEMYPNWMNPKQGIINITDHPTLDINFKKKGGKLPLYLKHFNYESNK